MSFLYSIALFPSYPCGRTPAPPTHENPRSTRPGPRRGSASTLNLSNAMPANYSCNTNFHTSQIIPQSSMISKSQLTIHTRFVRHFCDAEYQNSSQRNSQNAHAGLRAFLPLCCSAGTAVAQGSAARTFQTLRVHTLSLDVETINSIGSQNFTAKTMQKNSDRNSQSAAYQLESPEDSTSRAPLRVQEQAAAPGTHRVQSSNPRASHEIASEACHQLQGKGSRTRSEEHNPRTSKHF